MLIDEALKSGQISMEELRDMLTTSDAGEKGTGWPELSGSFRTLQGLNPDHELMTLLFEESFRYACEINLSLVEVRINRRGDEESILSYLRSIRDAYHKVRSEHPDFRARIIGTVGKRPSTSSRK